MQDIKFRAYCHAEKKIYTKLLVGNTTSPDIDNYTAHALFVDGEWKNFDEHSNVELMQYTGLKDKNGVEIYEGDIIRCYPDDISFSYLRTVEWDDDRCELGITTNGRSGLVLNKKTSHTVYVVGNIHQNPELIK